MVANLRRKDSAGAVNRRDVVIRIWVSPMAAAAHFIVDERISANLMHVGEAFVEGGQWALPAA